MPPLEMQCSVSIAESGVHALRAYCVCYSYLYIYIYIYIYVCVCVCVNTKKHVNGPLMGPTIVVRFMEVVYLQLLLKNKEKNLAIYI